MIGWARLVVATALLAGAALAHAQTRLQATRIAETSAELSEPHDGAFSPDGRLLYVTDMGASRMRVFEAMTLELVGTFGEGELSRPHDAAFDLQGRLLVADTGNDRIAIYAVDGAQATLIGELKDGLSGPEGVAIGALGRVIVSNTGASNVIVFRDGKREGWMGRFGSADREFFNPHDVEVASDGTLYVVDSGNNRVQVFDTQFRHLLSFGRALLDGPKYLHIEGDDLWLADEYNHRILRFDRQHRLVGQLGTGRPGRGANAFYKPEAVLSRKPYVWVIDTYNHRIVLLEVGR